MSTASVSYALNGRTADLSEATRRRVWEAVEALGYRPNLLAQSLAGRPTQCLGLVWVDGETGHGEGGLGAFFSGLGAAIYPSGHALMLAGGVSPAELGDRLQGLLSRQVDGLILLAAAFPSDEALIAQLQRQEQPLVVCGAAPDDLPVARVDLDQRRGVSLATAHLLGLGHRSLAYLDAPGEWPYGVRRKGFQDAVAVDGAVDVTIATTDGTEPGGYRVGEQLLTARARPTGFVCANDAVAVGFLRAAWKQGLAVPEQAAVVGFGDDPAAAYTIPALTTVRGSLRAVGETAGRILLAALAAGQPASGTHFVAPKLVVRESCGSHLWL